MTVSWLGAKVIALRSTTVGSGSALAAHALVRGDFPRGSVVGGVPGRVIKSRGDLYRDPVEAERRRHLEQIKGERRAALTRGGDLPGVL